MSERRCNVCKRLMTEKECGDAFDEELVCDECAGYVDIPDVGVVLKLVRLGNLCLVNDNPPNAPRFDIEQAPAYFTKLEYDRFSELLNSAPPVIQFYRSKFFAIDYKTIKYGDGEKGIAVMRDERGECHTIMSEGDVVWTKEL